MTGHEAALLDKLSTFLSGLSQKCALEAIKRWKTTRDQQSASEASATIDEHESAKGIATKIEQCVTLAIRGLKLTKEQIEEILMLETNPFLKERLVEKFLLSQISADYIEDLFISQNPRLECHRANQNQPLVSGSKPATLGQGFHNRFGLSFK